MCDYELKSYRQTNRYTYIINLRSKLNQMVDNTWVLLKETRTIWKTIYLPEVLCETLYGGHLTVVYDNQYIIVNNN